MAFSGSFDHSLDGKGRAIIPSSYREALGQDFTITINPMRTAVAIYPKEEWDKQLERLRRINPLDKTGLNYERYLMSVSFSGNNIDAQGRVLIPQKLRSKIGLTRDIVFVGLNDYIEIWDADVYAKMEAETESEFDTLINKQDQQEERRCRGCPISGQNEGMFHAMFRRAISRMTSCLLSVCRQAPQGTVCGI